MKKINRKPYAGYKRAHLISSIGTVVLGLCLIIAVIIMVTCFRVEVKVENPQPTTSQTQPAPTAATKEETPKVVVEETPAEAAETEKDNPQEIAPAETGEPAEVQPAETAPAAAETGKDNQVITPTETEEPGATPAEEIPTEETIEEPIAEDPLIETPEVDEPVEIQYSTATILVKVYSKYNGIVDTCTETNYTFTREVGYILTTAEINEEISTLYPSAKNIIISTKVPEEYVFTTEDVTLAGNVRVKMY